MKPNLALEAEARREFGNMWAGPSKVMKYPYIESIHSTRGDPKKPIGSLLELGEIDSRTTGPVWINQTWHKAAFNAMVTVNFYAPEIEDRGAYCFCPVCHSVILSL